MIRAIRRFWRRLLNRCVCCGRPLGFPRNDTYWRWPNFWACYRCNKTIAFGRIYGAGHRKLQEMTEK